MCLPCAASRIGKDDFKILKVIGRGSYGKVFLVERLNCPLQRHYAMKAMKKKMLVMSEQVDTVKGK